MDIRQVADITAHTSPAAEGGRGDQSPDAPELCRCPRCARVSRWTDGTETDFWCPTCGLETPADLCRVSPAAAGERGEAYDRLAEHVEDDTPLMRRLCDAYVEGNKP
jgi:hypothetical protein